MPTGGQAFLCRGGISVDIRTEFRQSVCSRWRLRVEERLRKAISVLEGSRKIMREAVEIYDEKERSG